MKKDVNKRRKAWRLSTVLIFSYFILSPMFVMVLNGLISRLVFGWAMMVVLIIATVLIIRIFKP